MPDTDSGCDNSDGNENTDENRGCFAAENVERASGGLNLMSDGKFVPFGIDIRGAWLRACIGCLAQQAVQLLEVFIIAKCINRLLVKVLRVGYLFENPIVLILHKT